MKEITALQEILVTLNNMMPELKNNYRVASLGVFGSFVRNTAQPDSDIDLLVTFDEVPGLIKFIELENLLTDRLGIKADLVMEDALKPKIGERILLEVVRL